MGEPEPPTMMPLAEPEPPPPRALPRRVLRLATLPPPCRLLEPPCSQPNRWRSPLALLACRRRRRSAEVRLPAGEVEGLSALRAAACDTGDGVATAAWRGEVPCCMCAIMESCKAFAATTVGAAAVVEATDEVSELLKEARNICRIDDWRDGGDCGPPPNTMLLLLRVARCGSDEVVDTLSLLLSSGGDGGSCCCCTGSGLGGCMETCLRDLVAAAAKAEAAGDGVEEGGGDDDAPLPFAMASVTRTA